MSAEGALERLPGIWDLRNTVRRKKMMNDPLASLMSNLLNAERTGKLELSSMPTSKVLIRVLELIKQHGYIKDFEVTEGTRGGVFRIKLSGKINKCGAIKPRFSVKKGDYEKFEKRHLPSSGFGLLILSTPLGIMTHAEAKEKNIGGKLLAYIY